MTRFRPFSFLTPHDFQNRHILRGLEEDALRRDLRAIDIVRHGRKLRLGAVDQPPVHHCLHVPLRPEIFGEVGDPDLAAGIEHVDGGGQQPAPGFIAQVIVEAQARK